MNLGLLTSENGTPKVAQWSISTYTFSSVGFIYVNFKIISETKIDVTLLMYNSISDWSNNTNLILTSQISIPVDLSVNTNLVPYVMDSVQAYILENYSIETIKA